MNALNKIILKTAVTGLVWTAVVFCYGLGIFAMSFPGMMASFYDTVGDKRLSTMYHERVYKRNPTPSNLYTILDKSIILKDHGRVIKYFDKFYDLPDYEARVVKIREYKEKRALKDGLTETLWELACNEDNRLRFSYIDALIAKKRIPEAIEAYGEHSEFILEIFREQLKTILGINDEDE